MKVVEDNQFDVAVQAELITPGELKENREIFVSNFMTLYSEASENLRELESTSLISVGGNVASNSSEIADLAKALRKQAQAVISDIPETFSVPTMEAILAKIIALFKSSDTLVDHQTRKKLIIIENQLIDLYAIASFLIDFELVAGNLENVFHLFSFEERYRRMSKEFNKRFSRYNGYRIDAKEGFFGMTLTFADESNQGDPEGRRRAIEIIKSRLEQFLTWELRKTGLDMKFNLTSSETTLSCDIRAERVFRSSLKSCESCGREVDELWHFASYRVDKFLCRECYTSYLHCMDN